MFKALLLATVFVASFFGVYSECANGCSGHGRCTSYDMCVCNRNWMANDCSERVCQFGLAHVDTPKGDLDMNGIVTDGAKVVADNSFVYPYGTTEAFPFCKDSELNDVPHSAHYYMECSNKGTCDRTTGTCACFDGYDGSACQRASCPGFPDSCSGHGVCRNIEQLANDDYGNIYKLWDRKSTMGCQCDKGYYGPDCSLRECKYGVDPLYLDDSATLRLATYDVAVLTTSPTIDFTDGTPLSGQAYFALRFYDIHGEDWLTRPIRTGATCDEVIAALEALPNNVVPVGQTWCTLTEGVNQFSVEGWVNGTDTHYPTGSDDLESTVGYQTAMPGSRLIKYPLAFWEQKVRSAYRGTYDNVHFNALASDVLSGYIYRLKFIGNPGELKQPEVEVYLDGTRPSINSPGGKVITKVWTDGQQGENVDFLADHCDGVTVQIGYDGTEPGLGPYFYLTGFTATEKALLKTCLGDSDMDVSNNVEVYNWDYGTKEYPHLVKLVKSRTTLTDGGYLAVIYFDSSPKTIIADNLGDQSVFRLMNPFFSPDDYAFGKQFQKGDLDLPSQRYAYTGKDQFEVYTTKGTLALTSNQSEATFGFGSQEIFMANVSYDIYQGYAAGRNTFDGDISCEIGANNGYKNQFVKHCLNKSDNFLLLNWDYPFYNPQHLNMFKAMKLSTKKYFASEAENFWGTKHQGFGYENVGSPAGPNAVTSNLMNRGSIPGSQDSHFMTHSIITDISTNWAQVVSDAPVFQVYKFFPSADSSYAYVAECSNRGICDDTTGVCNCFPGYAHDDCSQQNSLHV